MGRTFTEAEDQANAKVVVLSHELWQRRFGGNPSLLGQMLLLDREAHEVIGVMAPGFRTGYISTTLWTPLNVTEAGVPSGNTFIQTFARMRPDVSIQQLDAELGTVMKASIAENPKFLTDWSSFALPIREAQFRLQRPALLALGGGVAALLLIACANLANLMLAQFIARRSQLSLRAALGAGMTALLRLQVFEILLLAVVGGGTGVVIGRSMLPLLLALDPSRWATSVSAGLCSSRRGWPQSSSRSWRASCRSCATFAAISCAGWPRATAGPSGLPGIGVSARSSSPRSARSPWCCSRVRPSC
jgi:putative ABC transport system permease protein